MNSLNISTASALLLASLGIKVAKHGNKAVSSKCGSGDVLEALNIKIDFPWIKEGSQQYKDIKRFKWFSNDFLAVNPKNKNQIIDIRYSGLPNEIGGLWGIQLNANKSYDEHVKFVSMRTTTLERFKKLSNMIFKK